MADNTDSTSSFSTTNYTTFNGSDTTEHVTPNFTAQPSTKASPGGVSGGVVAVIILLFVIGIACLLLILYLRRSGKLQRFILLKGSLRARRDSSSSSRRPLEPDDIDHERDGDNVDMPKPRDGEMFTIEDFETDLGDTDRQSRGTNDEYFYDEVFGKSVFEDETTKASIGQLYLAAEDDDEMFDVDAIVRSVTGEKTELKKA